MIEETAPLPEKAEYTREKESPHMTFGWSAIVRIALSCIISEIKRDIGGKLRFFSYVPPFDAAGRSPSEYCYNVWCEITRMV